MCNPLLFGAVNSTTAICVGRGKNITEQYSKISTARDAHRFLNRDVAGLQERWDEFKAGMQKVCQSGTIQAQFHCAECNIMRKRLFELHSRVVQDPCREGESLMDGVDRTIRSKSNRAVK
ncbi:MAG: hypothetical protein RBT63_09810 [Bdellovibrionales bacterium]|jgi:hypothetical protein|nr:hypothetical protein [Bdellovibrionales bacterium]